MKPEELLEDLKLELTFLICKHSNPAAWDDLIEKIHKSNIPDASEFVELVRNLQTARDEYHRAFGEIQVYLMRRDQTGFEMN